MELLLLRAGKGRGATVPMGVAGTGASDWVGDGVDDEDDSEEGEDRDEGDEGGDVGSLNVNLGGQRPVLLRLELVLLLLAVLHPLSRLLLLLFLLSSSSSSSISSSCGLNLLPLLIRKNGG